MRRRMRNTYAQFMPRCPRKSPSTRPAAVGGISNRGGSAVNLFNPSIEFFRPFPRTGANLHVIYSPQWVAGGERWKTTHQVAVLIDRALFVRVF